MGDSCEAVLNVVTLCVCSLCVCSSNETDWNEEENPWKRRAECSRYGSRADNCGDDAPRENEPDEPGRR